MVWKIKDWDYMFQKATQYYEKHGDLLVPRLFSFEENNKIINLEAWINEHNYNVHIIDSNYNNSNYHKQDGNVLKTVEVVVTNY